MGVRKQNSILPRPRLWARKKTRGEAKTAVFSNPDQEAAWVAVDIERRIKNRATPDEIVIFTRTNRELARFGAALARLGIPYALETKEDVLDDPLIEHLVILMRAAALFGEAKNIVAVLHLDCFSVDELEIFTLAGAAARERRSLAAIVRDRGSKETRRVLDLLSSWSKYGHNHSMAELVSTIVRESGLLPRFLERPDAGEKLRAFLTFLEEHQRTHRAARLPDLLITLDLMDEYNVLKSGGVALPGRVRLMTAHSGKGLGFEHVYIAGMENGVWGNRRSRTTFHIPGLTPTTEEEEEQDERRLFYVAITRVKDTLTLTRAATREDGKEGLPSSYLAELDSTLIEEIEVKNGDDLAAARFAPILRRESPRNKIKLFVREAFFERGFSVTHLNNYLACPWRWFYRNLLRVPEPQNKHLMFGNAVHTALKKFFDGYACGDKMNKSEFLKTFNWALERECFTDKELIDALADGRKALGGYYERYKLVWRRETKNEFSVNVIFPLGKDELRLTGKLDKIELLDGGAVSVVDYKTGRPKTRNSIEGKTKEEGAGDYKRQLVFYKLLLNRFENGKYKMQNGVIDFIEPDERGKYHREEFTIAREDVIELEKEIKRVAEEILSLSFWKTKCENKRCEYCALRDCPSLP